MIREYSEADLEEVIQYYKNFNRNEIKLDSFSKIYIYELDKKIIGFIEFSIIYDRVELNYLFVDEKYRQRKVASKLLDFLILESKKNKCHNITLEVSEKNIIAINLYKQFGFVKKAVRKNYYKDADGILMIRELVVNE